LLFGAEINGVLREKRQRRDADAGGTP